MLEVEVVGEAGAELVEHARRFGIALDDHVRGDDVHAGGEGPRVEIVRIHDARGTQDVVSHLVQVDVARGRLQQDLHGFTKRVQVRGRMRAAMTTDAIGSIGVQPVSRITTPATMTASEPSRAASDPA